MSKCDIIIINITSARQPPSPNISPPVFAHSIDRHRPLLRVDRHHPQTTVVDRHCPLVDRHRKRRFRESQTRQNEHPKGNHAEPHNRGEAQPGLNNPPPFATTRSAPVIYHRSVVRQRSSAGSDVHRNGGRACLNLEKSLHARRSRLGRKRGSGYCLHLERRTFEVYSDW